MDLRPQGGSSRTRGSWRRGLAGFAIALGTAGLVAGIALAAPDAGSRDAGTKGATPKGDGGSSAAGSASAHAAANARIPPDPPPMSERMQWVFDLRYDNGDIYLLGVHKIDLGAPQATPRAMGRFAIELFEGPTLIERVRYDFPMLLFGGLPIPGDAGGPKQARFDDRLVSRIGVMFPATKRGTRLELWDRATDRRWPLPWPPTDTRPAHAPDGG